MIHRGGCHCGNLRVSLRLTLEPDEVRLRACGCSFCRSHNTRTASDPSGAVDLWADDWSLVHPYRFGTGIAEFMICQRCGIYIAAFGDTASGTRAVINTTASTTAPSSPANRRPPTTMARRPTIVLRAAPPTGRRRQSIVRLFCSISAPTAPPRLGAISRTALEA
jgi:hypothetical protein